jgi:hypothetical protein
MAALENPGMVKDVTVLPNAPRLKKLLSYGKQFSGFFYCHADYWFHPAFLMHSQWSENKLWYPDHICSPMMAEEYPGDMRIYENAWNRVPGFAVKVISDKVAAANRAAKTTATAWADKIKLTCHGWSDFVYVPRRACSLFRTIIGAFQFT